MIGYVAAPSSDRSNICWNYSATASLPWKNWTRDSNSWLWRFFLKTFATSPPLENHRPLFQFIPFLVFIQCHQCLQIILFALFVSIESRRHTNIARSPFVWDYLYSFFVPACPLRRKGWCWTRCSQGSLAWSKSSSSNSAHLKIAFRSALEWNSGF